MSVLSISELLMKVDKFLLQTTEQCHPKRYVQFFTFYVHTAPFRRHISSRKMQRLETMCEGLNFGFIYSRCQFSAEGYGRIPCKVIRSAFAFCTHTVTYLRLNPSPKLNQLESLCRGFNFGINDARWEMSAQDYLRMSSKAARVVLYIQCTYSSLSLAYFTA